MADSEELPHFKSFSIFPSLTKLSFILTRPQLQSESPSPPLPASTEVKQEPAAAIKREPVSPMPPQRPAVEVEDDRHRLQSESEQQAANFVSQLLDDDDDDVVAADDDDRFNVKEEIKEEPLRVVRQVRNFPGVCSTQGL